MNLEESCLPFPATRLADTQPLFTTQRLLAYLAAAIHADDYAGCEESFWLIALTPQRVPIARQRLNHGHLVAARVSCRDVFEVALMAGAGAIVCVRTQHGGMVHPGLADGRLLWDLYESAKHLNVLLIDYLITQIDGCAYYSYNEHRRTRE